MGMDNFRRRSHRTHAEHRAEKLERLIVRILGQYRPDIEVHDCDSCMINVHIFEREARALGIELEKETTR